MSTAQEERILYGFWLSPFLSVVAHALLESDLPFKYERVSPFIGDTFSGEQLARNPLGKIPSIKEPDGLIISESQAICRYLAKTYSSAGKFYPWNDPVECARVDTLNDFLTFSVAGPFFNWFVIGAYYPQAFRLKSETESTIFSKLSMVSVVGALNRVVRSSELNPYLLGEEPTMPDFQLFHILELGKTFSVMFDMPLINVLQFNESLFDFYEAMSTRQSTQVILEKQAEEEEITRREIFEEFGKVVTPDMKQGLQALFEHEF